MPEPPAPTSPALADPEPVDERLPATTVYVVSAPYVAIEPKAAPGASPGMRQMFTRGTVLPAWVDPALIDHFIRRGLVEAIGRHARALPRPQAVSEPAETAPPPVWEPRTRYRVLWQAVVIPDPSAGSVARQSPYYRGQTLPATVDHVTVDRLLAQGAIEPKRRPA